MPQRIEELKLKRKWVSSHTSGITYCRWHHHQGTRPECHVWGSRHSSASGHVKDTMPSLSRCVSVKATVEGIRCPVSNTPLFEVTWETALLRCHLCPLQTHTPHTHLTQAAVDKKLLPQATLCSPSTVRGSSITSVVSWLWQGKTQVYTFVSLLSGQALAWP